MIAPSKLKFGLDNSGGALKSALYFEKAHLPSATWTLPAGNCFCIFGRSGNTPVIVMIYGQPNSIKYLTSVDGGVAWSGQTIGSDGLIQGQEFSLSVPYPVYLKGKHFFPICHDGTDIFVVTGSNAHPGKPFAQKHSGWVINLEEAEVI